MTPTTRPPLRSPLCYYSLQVLYLLNLLWEIHELYASLLTLVCCWAVDIPANLRCSSACTNYQQHPQSDVAKFGPKQCSNRSIYRGHLIEIRTMGRFLKKHSFFSFFFYLWGQDRKVPFYSENKSVLFEFSNQNVLSPKHLMTFCRQFRIILTELFLKPVWPYFQFSTLILTIPIV
jgi:hypothetical protein